MEIDRKLHGTVIDHQNCIALIARCRKKYSRSRCCTPGEDLAVKKQLRDPVQGTHTEGCNVELEPWRGSLT